MARYFNRTQGPLTVVLKTGETAFVQRKATLEVTEAQDGSASIHSRVKRNLLVRLPDTPKIPEQQSSDHSVASAIEPVETVSLEGVVFEEDSSKPYHEQTKAELIEVAEALGIDVKGRTKKEIIQALEGAGQ